jgi:virulence factor Mce-like protein
MKDRYLAYGLMFVLVMGLVVTGTVMLYRDSFAKTVPVVVRADRAGLTMDQGAPVKLRGVEVGKVKSVRSTADGAEIDLDILDEYVDRIPADVTAQIVPPTAFGAKFVQLTSAGPAAGRSIRAGAVIAVDYVNVEVNTAFENLTKVLEAARPNEVNNALTALAVAVDDRGEKLGTLVTQIDRYLASFNPSLPTLSADLRRTDRVLSIYDAAWPDIIATARNAGVTSATVAQRQAALHAFLLNLTSFSNRTDRVVTSNADGVTHLMDLLDPLTALLARYSPELPCIIRGAAVTNGLAEKAVGGTNPGVTTFTGIQPGDDPYVAPRNLPQIGEHRGPNCMGLPVVSHAAALAPNPIFNSGANPYAESPRSGAEELSGTFLGLLAGAVGSR